MWCRLKNWFRSFQTYDDLSPDLGVRRRVNRRLRQRPALVHSVWFESCCRPLGISSAIAQFGYQHLAQYSGLSFAHVLPSDRLEEDLRWTAVCWFDWQLHLCEDVWQAFGVDLSDQLDQIEAGTVADLLVFLQQQVYSNVAPAS